MFTVRWLNPYYFLVRINRKKQYEKRNMQNGLYVAPTMSFMRFNQQAGELVAIGQGKGLTQYREDFSGGGVRRVPFPSAQELLPQARVGDTLLFSHIIEGSVETKNAEQVEYDNQYLAHQDDEWRYYWVRGDFAYGVAKDDGTIFVTPDTLLARPAEDELDNREMVKIGSIFLIKNFKENHEAIQQKIEQLKLETQEYTNREKALATQREMERLTQEKNKIRFAAFVPLVVNEKFNRDCGRKITEKDVVYYQLVGGSALDLQVTELEYNGVNYSLLKPDYVVGVTKSDSQSALQD